MPESERSEKSSNKRFSQREMHVKPNVKHASDIFELDKNIASG